MKNLLLSEKYRPKSMEELVILPRIKKLFENGLNENYIFYGHFGTGKTSLARILIGKYSKDTPMLEINSSKYTSIDTLRTVIDDFCTKVYMGLDMNIDIKKDSMKYVFLDEFDRTSAQYQDALKVYIEEYSAKNVRFIFVTNHINKISKGITSRVNAINFDCINAEEEKELKTLFFKRVMENIAPKEGFDISKEDLKLIIKKNFPDFRQTLIAIDFFIKNGELSNSNNIDIKKRNQLFDIVLCNIQMNFNEIYHYLMDDFGADKIDDMIFLLGRPFVDFVLENYPNKTEMLFLSCSIVTEHTKLLDTNTDPIILGITVIDKMRKIFNI